MKKIFILALVAIALFGCKKETTEQPVDESLNPVLVSMTVGTNASSIIKVEKDK